VPIDAQQCLGFNDAPMSEFWAASWKHRVGEADRFFVKQPASAAHTYGRQLVLAEGFTTIGPHWQETLWDNLKPVLRSGRLRGIQSPDVARVRVLARRDGLPGSSISPARTQPNVTWWEKSAPFFAYLNRCQALLQRGRFVADVAVYYGATADISRSSKKSDLGKILPGYD